MLIKSLTKVDKLTRRVENLYDQKEYEEKRREQQEARLKQVNEADVITKTDFWCTRCRQDTTGMAYKHVFEDTDLGFCAYYESFSKGKWPNQITTCCKGLRRYITDKLWDPYYNESLLIRKQRAEALASGDLLQPGDYGFVTKYGDPNKKKYAQMEKEERANFQKKITTKL